ncbi:MAG: heavy metal-binding domain-containing protein [Candidatus Omnitrophota bacterium]
MGELIYLIILIALGYFVGTRVERRHYRLIEERERNLLHLPAVCGKDFLEDRAISESRLVYGSVVVSTDYFKLILAGLRNLLGGEISAYESILDRGRRESVLRMKEKAVGADIILNLRIETSRITEMGSMEVFAYGTAVYYNR